MTFDGSMLRVFVNGAQVASDPLTGSIATSTLPLRIGGDTIWGEWFAGEIDNLRVYDRALTGAEVQKDMTTAVRGVRLSRHVGTHRAERASARPGQTQTSITLNWNASSDNVGVAGYGLYRDGTGAGNTAAATRSFTFSGLTCGTSYTLAVDAYDAADNRSSRTSQTASTTACAQQPSPDYQAPSTPGNLTVTGAATDSVRSRAGRRRPTTSASRATACIATELGGEHGRRDEDVHVRRPDLRHELHARCRRSGRGR